MSAFAPDRVADALPVGREGAGRLSRQPIAARWRDYDATALIEDRGWRGPALLVDQGTSDPFLERQLKPELLREACERAGVALDLRLRDGYDHSYFFIATFIEDHLRFHARHLFA